MTRFLFVAAASLFATPALASSYSATLGTTSTTPRIMGKDIAWSCDAGRCTGKTETSRPVVLCQDLARRAGTVARFLVDGRPLDSERLGQCNAVAKGARAPLASAN
ncbi:CC_3452 family protein [Sphingomonas xanthus]|uniref:CC_3452 family protein n=1 Tax=Sphingomonas xanthus TaxID=2594473 RepID=UPI001FE39E02|nr:hypothetical protein [Sphingomonas xanthus]